MQLLHSLKSNAFPSHNIPHCRSQSQTRSHLTLLSRNWKLCHDDLISTFQDWINNKNWFWKPCTVWKSHNSHDGIVNSAILNLIVYEVRNGQVSSCTMKVQFETHLGKFKCFRLKSAVDRSTWNISELLVRDCAWFAFERRQCKAGCPAWAALNAPGKPINFNCTHLWCK